MTSTSMKNDPQNYKMEESIHAKHLLYNLSMAGGDGLLYKIPNNIEIESYLLGVGANHLLHSRRDYWKEKITQKVPILEPPAIRATITAILPKPFMIEKYQYY